MYARFKGSIWAADLTEMGSLSSKYQGVKYVLCAMDVFTKYARVKAFFKDTCTKTALHVFIEIINESKCKPNK